MGKFYQFLVVWKKAKKGVKMGDGIALLYSMDGGCLPIGELSITKNVILWF